MLSLLPALRQAAPRLSRHIFCPRCLSAATRPPIKRPSMLKNIRFNSSAYTSPAAPAGTSPLGSLSKTITGKHAKISFFPENNQQIVAYWLLGSAASVFGIVILGGLTRLTESGLSITEWRPVTGSLPPLSAGDWDSEFTKYKSSPEFMLLNPHMTLPEFKQIYYMEWGHRLWGRVVGLSFILPAAYFVARRKVSAPMALRMAGIGGLIGLQGVLGWWMVKSGLKDDLFAPGSHPRVSQYRLTAHLGTAFLCYTAMLWNGLSILRENRLLADPVSATKELQLLRNPTLRLFRRSVIGLAGLVFLTAMSGGLVAGLDAGLIYNEFPYMGTGFAPPSAELFSDFYSRQPDHSDLWWRNMLENPSTVQLDHRILATTTLSAVLALWAYSRYGRSVRAALPATAKKGVRGVVHLVSLQVVLGIATLLYLVPVPLAAAHQANSLALLTGVVVLASRVRLPPRRTVKLLAERMAKGATAASRISIGARSSSAARSSPARAFSSSPTSL
ncbi:MAG: Cytochrome c oxidase assembly protein cox15 [Thelocarpon superellum]|nr:MAG: Cytochrome c oxidase assembly protein cox15 [Thelocarpon superellum]